MPAAHILVVDDDRDTRELYRLVFEMADYAVSEAGSVADGVMLANTARPDAILADWRLADGDGFALCGALRARGATRHIPIVAATGMSLSADDVARARALGCGEVLTKPVDLDARVGAIERATVATGARRLRAAALRAERFLTRIRRKDANAACSGSCLASLVIAHEARRAGSGVALIVADDRGRYIAANDSAASLTGYEPQELTRLSVWDIAPSPSVAVAQELWSQFIRRGNQEGQYELRRRSGEHVRAQYVAVANIAPGLHLSALAPAASSQVSASR